MSAFAATTVCAQSQTNVRSRIHEPIDDSRRVPLQGHVHPMAQARFDRGAAPAGLPVEHMVLLLKRTPEQDQELATLLEDQNDASSPQYHKWLTPEEFGERFGVSGPDLQTVTSWLTANGFQVDNVAKGRNFIEFSGSADTLRSAFRTEMHRYLVGGVSHWANSNVPTIPSALAPVVEGFTSLNDFHSKPQIGSFDGPVAMAKGVAPQMTFSGGVHALSPADYSVIYNIKPLYQSSINGAGATIAVTGRSNIDVQDVVDFRNFFGLVANPPQVVVNGTDPGKAAGGELTEAVLDTTWAGAVAPNATVKLVVSASTNTTDVVLLSEQYNINNNLADILTTSFGVCESQNSGAVWSINALAQQAAAQGMTFLVATGDSGSAGCDDPTAATAAQYGTSVNLMASTPYTVAVGGTELNDAANPAQYWTGTNNAGYSSALSYIPEKVWNDSCAAGASGCTTANIWAGGGGASIFFAKPSWQTGVAGIPADGHRDVPDVSLTASSHDPYLLCMSGSCQSNRFYLIGGTSASAPAFAGILAMAKQRAGVRLGLVNPTLYRLAASQAGSQCNASGAPASNCIFNDVTSGNNSVPGESGYGTSSATYPAGAGFDLATGLGSVNAYNLVSAWGSAPARAATMTVLSLSPTVIATGATSTVTVWVGQRSGAGTLTGSVSLVTSEGATVATLTLSGGAVVANVGGWPAGSYGVVAHYSGDSSNAPSDSASIAVTAGSANARLSPAALSFGSVNVGGASAQNVVLTNSGAAPLTGIAVSVTGADAADFSQTNTCGASVAAGATCTISVTFRPAAAGGRSATLNVASGATKLTAALSGTGVASPVGPTLSPTSAVWGTVALGASGTVQMLTLSNPAATSVTGIAITLAGANPGDFGGWTNCTPTLAAGASCSISLYFTPRAAGARTATLNIANSVSPLAAALSGTGATTSSTYTVSAPATAAAGSTIAVNWTAPAGHSATDYIALRSTAGYSSFKRTGPATSGSVAFQLPAAPGTYFASYLAGSAYTVAAESGTITVN